MPSLDKKATQVLRDWLMSDEHFNHPYPTSAERQDLAQRSALSPKQVANWFVNARKRIWRPLRRKMEASATAQGEGPMAATVLDNPPHFLINLEANKYLEYGTSPKQLSPTGVTSAPPAVLQGKPRFGNEGNSFWGDKERPVGNSPLYVCCQPLGEPSPGGYYNAATYGGPALSPAGSFASTSQERRSVVSDGGGSPQYMMREPGSRPISMPSRHKDYIRSHKTARYTPKATKKKEEKVHEKLKYQRSKTEGELLYPGGLSLSYPTYQTKNANGNYGTLQLQQSSTYKDTLSMVSGNISPTEPVPVQNTLPLQQYYFNCDDKINNSFAEPSGASKEELFQREDQTAAVSTDSYYQTKYHEDLHPTFTQPYVTEQYPIQAQSDEQFRMGGSSSGNLYQSLLPDNYTMTVETNGSMLQKLCSPEVDTMAYRCPPRNTVLPAELSAPPVTFLNQIIAGINDDNATSSLCPIGPTITAVSDTRYLENSNFWGP